MGFNQDYWKKNFSDPQSMDGIGNAKEHARYLSNFFDLENVEVRSLIDFGFGHGVLLKELFKTFKPKRAAGVEPSKFILKQAVKTLSKYPIEIYPESIIDWCRHMKSDKTVFDLGVCLSVFQYLTDDEIKTVLPILKKKVKVLYFTAPTDIELKRQIKEHKFKDEYAIHRSRKRYHELFSPHFTVISARILESKYYFNEKNTPFTDLIYRF